MSAEAEVLVGGRRYRIERAVEDDLPALVALIGDDPVGGPRESDELAPYAAAYARIDGDPAHLLVAVRDETEAVVGTMQLTLMPSLARGGVLRLQIEAVHVARSVQGRGLGSAMMRWALSYGREHGAGLAQLTSDKRRADAHRFYERLGFVATHEGMKLPLGPS